MGQCHLHIQQWNLSRVHTCFDVNALWVEAVLSLNEKRTFDFLFSHIHEETIKDDGQGCIYQPCQRLSGPC